MSHAEPAWREQADFMFIADLTDHGHEGRWEQLWMKSLGDDLYQLCCIPFSLYGVALGDVVKVADSSRPSRIVEVVRRHGHSTLRVAAVHPHERSVHTAVHQLLTEFRAANEWMGEKYVALDAASAAARTAMWPKVAELQANGWAFTEDAGDPSLGLGFARDREPI